MKILRPTDAAYLAGIIDGEGHISISKRPPNKRSGERNPTYLPSLRIGSTNPHLLDWIMEKVGEGSMFQEGRAWGEGRKPFYMWNISNKQVDRLFDQVYPYLVMKKRQVDEVRKLRETTKTAHCRAGVPEDVMAERERCFRSLAKLHKLRYLPASHFDLP